MIISDLHLIAGIISGLDYKCLSFQDSAPNPPQRFPGFLLPTVRSKVDDVPTVPTAPPTTAKTTTSTTTTVKTTTTTTFELTPLSTEPTTPRVYVSTSNFRPTLPNFGQEEEEEELTSQEEEQEEVVEQPETVVTDVKVPRVPLVLAPQSTSTTTSTTTSSTTTSTTTSSSSTSESSFNIHNRLDELASNLDPWAHIQQAAQKVSSQSELYNYLSCEIILQT